jgi:hypothetical protein
MTSRPRHGAVEQYKYFNNEQQHLCNTLQSQGHPDCPIRTVSVVRGFFAAVGWFGIGQVSLIRSRAHDIRICCAQDGFLNYGFGPWDIQ